MASTNRPPHLHHPSISSTPASDLEYRIPLDSSVDVHSYPPETASASSPSSNGRPSLSITPNDKNRPRRNRARAFSLLVNPSKAGKNTIFGGGGRDRTGFTRLATEDEDEDEEEGGDDRRGSIAGTRNGEDDTESGLGIGMVDLPMGEGWRMIVNDSSDGTGAGGGSRFESLSVREIVWMSVSALAVTSISLVALGIVVS